MNMIGERYECAHCGGEYLTAWTSAEADAEYTANFPEVGADAPRSLVCDDCYRRFITVLPRLRGFS